MGCQGSQEYQEPLEDELEHELNYQANNKKNQEVDRFDSNKPEQGFDNLFEAQVQNDEQFMATKPWIGALVKPSQQPQNNPSVPDENLTLKFVNGFKVEDSRQNMFWGTNPNEVIYCAAALGIVMNTDTLKQRYMGAGDKNTAKGHTDDVMALGVCPQRKRVVTGSLGSRPQIIVWNSQTMQVLGRTKLGRNTRAISSIRFSRDGKYFFCSDKHNDSNVYCFESEGCRLVGQDKCGSDPVFDGQSGNGNKFATATKRGIHFFTFNGSELQEKRGIFSGHPMKSMITVTYNPENDIFYSGSSNGCVYSWGGNACTKHDQMHQGTVMGLNFTSGKLLSCGSKDNVLKVSVNGEVQNTFDLPSYARSLDLHNGNILVGTKCGAMLRINEQTKEIKTVMQGHWTGQTWGLALDGNGGVYTTGDDNNIFCFNSKTFKVQKKGTINETRGKKFRIGGASTLSLLPPNQQSRAIAISDNGDVAIACNDGYLSIRTKQDLNTQKYGTKIARQWIEVMKYSPNQQKLAVGSHDNKIYILNTNDNYSPVCTMSAHQSFITNLDWSTDGNAVQSNCGAYQYLFHDANSGDQLKSGASQFKDQKWATYSVKLGWWVQGIFPSNTDGSHVNGVCRNNKGNVIATADDWGFVNLYRNPALKGAKWKSYRAHSSHVVRVIFDKNDNHLYTVGGYDKTLMMWEVA